MRYRDFVVEIRSSERGNAAVAVVLSPAGQGSGPLATDGIPEGWSRQSERSVMRDLADHRGISGSNLSAEEMGARLYRALFPPAVRSLYERSVELAATESAGLRLKVLLNPADRAVRVLQGLPWELLFRDEIGEFLALNPATPIVRALAIPRVPREASLPRSVRVLAAQALPRDVTDLDLERELRSLEAARDQGPVEVVRWTARLAELRETLAEKGPFEVIHFLGHGTFPSGGDEGFLYFEDEAGNQDLVRPIDLCQKLQGFTSLRLIVLNACRTSRNNEGRDGRPFGGVAAALVQAGFPAVLAMQETIQDEHAIAFSRSFYRGLARRLPLEAALTEGRQAVHSLDRSGFAWAVPNLFLRVASPEGDAAPPCSRPTGSQDDIRSSLDLFFAGDYSPALARFRAHLSKDPSLEQARLFEAISRVAASSSLSHSALSEVDQSLQRCIAARDPEVARTARLALGIIRLDLIQPQGLRVEGVPTSALIQELRGQSWTPKQQGIADALRASRATRTLLRLQT